MHPLKHPQRLVTEFLDRTREAILKHCFRDFAACFHLPYTAESFDGLLHVEDEAALRHMFDSNMVYYRMIGMTDLHRHCEMAEFADTDLVTGVYESRVICHQSGLTRAPYLAFVVLQQKDGVWGMVSTQYAIDDAPPHSRVLVGRHPVSGEMQPVLRVGDRV